MNPLISIRAIALGVGLLAASVGQAAAASQHECAVFDIHEVGSARLRQIYAVQGLEVQLELDSDLLACGSKDALDDIEELAAVTRRLGRLDVSRVSLAYRLSHAEIKGRGLRVLAAGGLFAVVESERPFATGERRPPGLLPFHSRRVLARQVANQPRQATAVASAGTGTVASLVAELDADRWFADVESLAEFNRYSLGSDIENARQWLVEEFKRIPGLKVRSRYFEVNGTQVANVVAKLRGRSRPRDLFIVGGHYDSTSDDPMTTAPGAEDNASGCAGVLEIARVFAANPPEATILFICYAGEEQGLHGAVEHAAGLTSADRIGDIGAMLNLDMIGFTEDDDLDCLLQSSADWQSLIDALIAAAEVHTELRLVTSLLLGGSDHVPYASSGIPAVLSIENDWSAYPHYHRTTDTPDMLTPEMALEILRMNVGALAPMVGVSDASGCLELDDGPFADVKVVSLQRGEPRQVAHTDRLGCFAVDPLAREKRFKLRVKSPGEHHESGRLNGCVRLLGEPLAGRRAVLRQPGEPLQAMSSDADGCFAFDLIGDKALTLIFKGSKVPAAASD